CGNSGSASRAVPADTPLASFPPALRLSVRPQTPTPTRRPIRSRPRPSVPFPRRLQTWRSATRPVHELAWPYHDKFIARRGHNAKIELRGPRPAAPATLPTEINL